MGQEASTPVPGTKFPESFGAGLPRIRTASLAKALEILLQGPVYHGGTQVHSPIRSAADKTFILATILGAMQGYAATTDVPAMLFVPELMKLHPDAKVVCTVRDPDAWAKSIDATSQQSLAWYL
ncbi:hypothetical protein SCUP515_08697 [Seiridium cupressi]